MNAYLGIDVGGTKIAAGIFDENKKLIASFKVPTYDEQCPECFSKALAQDIEKLMEKAGVSTLCGIGVGVPGIVQNGVIINTPNIKCLKGFDLGKTLKEQGYEFVFINDLILKENYTIDHAGKQCAKKDGQ